MHCDGEDGFLVHALQREDDLLRHDIPPDDATILAAADNILLRRVMDAEGRRDGELLVLVTGVLFEAVAGETNNAQKSAHAAI
jgi:hypothetical protein